ncbi:hypothetical protein P5V15_001023 [Pogonomyrmex californicus]
MLLTFLYMVATIMQARRISFLKAHLNVIFKGNKNRSSIMLNIKSSQYLNGDCNGYEQDENFMSSHLCTNKSLAKLDELLWYQDNIKLYTIYPQQQVNISDWLTYPCGSSLFPLCTNNCCQILNKSDVKMHILVEVDLETYKSQASTICAKLEDYGLITAWTASNKDMSFILETDMEHMTSFIIGIMQGQYFINNNLLLIHIQYIFYLLSNAARIAFQQNKLIEVAKLCGVNVQPQDKNLNTEISTDSADTKSTSSKPTTSHSSSVAASITQQDIEIPFNLNSTLSKEMPTAINGRERSDHLTKTHLPDIIENKDNTLLDIKSEVSTKNIDQDKLTRETTNLEASSTTFKLEKKKLIKPPNIIIYADSPNAISNIKNVLLKVLEPDKYVIYAFSREDARLNAWVDQVTLVVICGNVDAEFGAQLVEYIIHGGKLLALCSDMLHTLLPSFKTAEVRESELVHFSYGKWKRVRMMHHIFCYHASPVRTRFSQDQEDTRTPALNPPTSTSVKDKRGKLHSFDVKVLSREETWHNPSILLATLASSGGKVVFSQIHLEIDPMQYEYEEDKFEALKKSNVARLEIISDLLSTHLGLETSHDQISIQYTSAYFLGKFEMKMKMFEKLKSKMQENNILKMPNLDIRFYANNEDVQASSANFLPIMMHMCPPNFSTVDYFENLYTKELGRLVIYVDVLSSSMYVVNGRLEHGLTVIPRRQTQGQGRSRNMWLSPVGCAMFTLQVHIPISSYLGSHISLLQHIAAVALVSAVRSIEGYENLDLKVKWPNDIYINNTIKIGGLIIPTQIEESLCICNIGAGVNLSNNKPTSCINDIILQYNQKYGTKLKTFSYEKYLALVFNELEILLDIVQSGNVEHFYQLYYKYWLHM